MSGVVPVEHLRAALRLISPEHITPMGKRIIEQVIEKYEQPCAHLHQGVRPGGGTVCLDCGIDTSHFDAMGG